MATITEDYVSFEIAKLLKEKGFDEDCWCWYEEDGYLRESNDDFGVQSNSDHVVDDDEFNCSAPTIQMAMKWLREVYNIDIEVHTDVGILGVKVYTPFISRYKSSTEYPSKLRQYKNGLYFEDDRGVIPGIRHFETYEEAVETALMYCLKNLI